MHRARQFIASAISFTAPWLAFCSRLPAQVITDRTLGHAPITLSGPNFSIGPNLGQVRGGNVFHSFRQFNLTTGESADFTGPSSIHNVIVRVTDGPASIDGTVRCDIPAANFYLVDSAGVVFGPDAALAVNGSFAVTTADVLRLGKTGSFAATKLSTTKLTSASPAAFGFLGSPAGKGQSANIQVNGSLVVGNGQVLSVVGGSVQIVTTGASAAGLNAPGGRINLISAASAGEAAFDAASPTANVDVSSIKQLGSVSLSKTVGGNFVTAVNVDTPVSNPSPAIGSGSVVVRAGDLSLDHLAQIHGSTTSAAGGNIDLALQGNLTVSGGSEIFTNTTGAGNAGSVLVSSDSVHLTLNGGLFAATFGSGAGGVIQVRARTIALDTGGEMDAPAGAAGAGAGIDIHANTITMDGTPPGSGLNITGVIAENPINTPLAQFTGSPGSIHVQTSRLAVRNAALISDTTRGSSAGGEVDITASHVLLDGDKLNAVTGIVANSQSRVNPRTGHLKPEADAGAGGTIDVNAKRIDVFGGASIASNTFTQGDAGTLNVNASNAIFMDGENFKFFTGFFGTTSLATGGNGAIIHVTTDSLTLLRGSTIRTNTFGDGSAGKVVVHTGNIFIDRHGAPENTGIGAQVEVGANGHGGDMKVDVNGTLTILNAGRVSVDSFGNGPGGTLHVHAGAIILNDGGTLESDSESAAPAAVGRATAGDLFVSATHSITVNSGGIINAFARSAQAGNVKVSAGNSLSLSHASITAEAPHPGDDGGSISITAPIVRLFQSSILTQAAFNGGNVHFDPTFVILNASTVNASAGNNGGNVTGKPNQTLESLGSVINVTGVNGVNGNVTLPPPNSTIASSLARLPATLEADSLTLQPACGQMSDFSTFLIQGRGSIAQEPGLWEIDLVPRGGNGNPQP